MENLITIGKITRFQGNKGEVRVHPLTDFPERFTHLDKVYLVKNDEIKEKIIENCWFHNQYIIIKFVDINDIDMAQQLKNYLLKIPQEKAVPLLENEYYLFQLQDMKVKTLDDRILGQLDDILKTGGVDIFIIKGKDKEYMIPASKEIITEINEKEGFIIIDPIPGLLEL